MTFFSWDVLGPSTVLLGGLVLGVLVDRLVPRRTWLGSGLPATAAVVAALVLVVVQDRPGLLSLVAALGVLLVANVVNYEESMPPALFHAGVLVSAAGGVVAERVADVAGAVVALAISALAAIALAGVRTGDAEARRDARTTLSAVAGAAVVSFAAALVVESELRGALVGRGVLGELGWFAYGPPEGLSAGAPAAVAVVAVLPLVVAGGLPSRFPVVVLPRASVVVVGLMATVPAVSGALLVSQLLGFFAATGGHADLLAAELVVTLCLLGATIGVLRARDLLGLVRWTTLGTSAVAMAGFLADDVGVWLLVQVLAVLGLVGMLAVAARRRGGVEPTRLRGLVRTEPVMGVAVVVALLARAALPPSWTASSSAWHLLDAAWDARWFLGVAVAAYLVAAAVAVLRAVAGLVAPPTETVQLSPSPPVSIRVATTTVVLAALVLLLLPLSY